MNLENVLPNMSYSNGILKSPISSFSKWTWIHFDPEINYKCHAVQHGK